MGLTVLVIVLLGAEELPSADAGQPEAAADAPLAEPAALVPSPDERELIAKERARLEAQRPSLAPAYVFFALALGHLGPALYAFIETYTSRFGPHPIPVMIGTVVLAQSVALSVVAFTELMRRFRERDELDCELANLTSVSQIRKEVPAPDYGPARWLQVSTGVSVGLTGGIEGVFATGLRLPPARRLVLAVDLRGQWGNSRVNYGPGAMTAPRWASVGISIGPQWRAWISGVNAVAVAVAPAAWVDVVGPPTNLPGMMFVSQEPSTRVEFAVGGIASVTYIREIDERFALIAELDYAGTGLFDQNLAVMVPTSQFRRSLAAETWRHQVGLRIGFRL